MSPTDLDPLEPSLVQHHQRVAVIGAGQRLHRLEIAELVQNWAVWCDAGHWDRFATCWHPEGRTFATWCRAPAADFIAASRTS